MSMISVRLEERLEYSRATSLLRVPSPSLKAEPMRLGVRVTCLEAEEPDLFQLP